MKRLFLLLLLSILVLNCYALPDYQLAIEMADRAEDSVTFIVFTGNAGDASNSSSVTLVQTPGGNVSIDVPAIGAEGFEYELAVPCSDGEEVMVSGAADSGNAIGESDESNNGASTSGSCGMPDLAAEITIVGNYSNSYQRGYNVSIIISNIGSGMSQPTITRIYSPEDNADFNIATPALEPGQSAAAYETAVPCWSTSPVHVYITADSTGANQEPNEANNNASVTLDCSSQAVCRETGSACSSGGQCCTNYCSNGTCAIPCAQNGMACAAASDCCSGRCNPVSNVCESLYSCRQNGEACAVFSSCCSNYCNSEGICANPPVPECASSGVVCSADSQCCSGVCDGGICGIQQNPELPHFTVSGIARSPQLVGANFFLRISVLRHDYGFQTTVRTLFGGMEVSAVRVYSYMANMVYSFSVNITCPSAGSFPLLVVADRGQGGQEDIENSWNKTIECVASAEDLPTRPDLMIISVEMPQQSIIGANSTARIVVRNNGFGPAGPSYLSFGLNDSTVEYPVPELAPDAEYALDARILCPNAGEFVALAIADSRQQVDETDDLHNEAQYRVVCEEASPASQQNGSLNVTQSANLTQNLSIRINATVPPDSNGDSPPTPKQQGLLEMIWEFLLSIWRALFGG